MTGSGSGAGQPPNGISAVARPSEIVLALEECAYAAWPAADAEDLDGWRLRATQGVTRRANSAWTARTGGRLALPARIERVETFYATRALPSVVQLSAATATPGLDDFLARRGYRMEGAVSVQTADASHAAAAPPGPSRAGGARIGVRVEDRPFGAWLEVSCRQGRFAAVEDIYRGLIDRITAPALFAMGEIGGEPVAAGMAVVDGTWGGIFSMLTLGASRRRGLASAILRALASEALARGARGLYLQVERDNQDALALYSRFGFTERYGYHYRVGARTG